MNNQNENIFNFEKLIVYQKALDFIDITYTLTDKFSKYEQYNLTDQFRRAATSIALNIGEGSGGTDKEFNNFLRISKRSLKECVVFITIALRRNYISEKGEKEMRLKLVEIAKMNSGLSRSIKTKSTTSAQLHSPFSSLPNPN